jgi:hypothetical protein
MKKGESWKRGKILNPGFKGLVELIFDIVQMNDIRIKNSV